MNCESRANDDYNTPLTTREIITDKVSQKVYDLYYKTTKNPNLDFDLIQNQNRIYKY